MLNLLRVSYYLASALRRPYWERRKLRKFQEKRLQSVVNYAYHFVPFYHEKFRKAQIRPGDIRSLEDLSKLPLIKKRDLKLEDPRRLISSEFDMHNLKPDRTSGSTGQPFITYLTRTEDAWRKAIYMRANISCGQKPRDRWVFIAAPSHFSDTTSIQRRLGIFAQNCVSVFNSVDRQIALVDQARPQILDGYSGSLLLLAKEVERRGLKSIQPKIVFGSADFVDDASRRFMEEVFEAPYYDQFGCAEIDRSAWQCPEKIGYHMDIDSVITQFVDDEGVEVSEGESGEVAYTSLFNYAMPFIRYAIGDIGVLTDEECPCGRNFPLMKVVEGRKDSILRLPDGRLLSPRAVTNAISKFIDEIIQYRVIQKRADLLEIYIRKKDHVNERYLQMELVKHLNRVLDLDKYNVIIDVLFVDEVPPSRTGKLVAVVSELKA